MNWPIMMRLAAERFGVAPAAFWRLSLMEWRALTGRPEEPAMTRAGLERLAAVWPDQQRCEGSASLAGVEPSLAPSTASRSPSPASGGGDR